jgi:putative ATPase
MPQDESMDLFPSQPKRRLDPHAPLADRMRPKRFEEMLGQDHLVGAGTALRSMVESGNMPSMILWGPPGSGKTTLAWLLAEARDTRIEPMSAVTSGVKEIREAVETARRTALRTLLFIDEIHRLNRAQQDVLLPHVEAGTVTLIGATTENPSFTVNAPLLSRCRVFTLTPLGDDAVAATLEHAVSDAQRGLGASGLQLVPESLRAIVDYASGDARKALGLLEAAASIHLQGEHAGAPLPPETVREAAGQKLLLYDRDREEHYNVISAFIKSMRASDPDAALYYLARMLAAGEDPLFVARRILIFAAEDVGNADPWALSLAIATHQASERLGMPEARIPLAQATSYLACAIKSNASYAAIGRAMTAVEETGSLPVPMHLRNAPTRLMKSQGYGEGYEYPHDAEGHFTPSHNLPETLDGREFYTPGEQGAEASIAARLEKWREARRRSRR